MRGFFEIKRYSAADIAFQCEHSTEADNPKWCRYADIAALEAKAACQCNSTPKTVTTDTGTVSVCERCSTSWFTPYAKHSTAAEEGQ